MRVLLDTCVLSELNRQGGGEQKVIQAVTDLPDNSIFVSVIAFGEIAKGVALLDAGACQRGLLSWLNNLEIEFADRLLFADSETSRIWGELTARALRNGRSVSVCDGLIAATLPCAMGFML